MTGRTFRNQNMLHPTAIMAVLMLIGIFSYFLLIGYMNVRSSKEKFETVTNNLRNIFQDDIFPQYLQITKNGLLRHLYSYSPKRIIIDGDVTDWETEHANDINLNKLTLIESGPKGLTNSIQSWLDADFVRTDPPVLYFTPYTINTLSVLGEKRIENTPTVRLRFASDSGDDLYMLVHMVNVGPDKSVRLRLNVHYSDPEKNQGQEFAIFPVTDRNLNIYEITSSGDYEGVSEEKAFGKWSESSEDEFFELQLRNVRETDAAIELVAFVHEGNDPFSGIDFTDPKQRQRQDLQLPLLRVGSSDPLSLQGPIFSYAIDRLLKRLPGGHPGDYQVSRGNQVLLSSSQAAEGISATRIPWFLKLIYRLSLSFNNIIECPSKHASDNVCFVYTSSYWLSQQRPLEDNETVMVKKNDNLKIDFPGISLVIPVIVVLVILLVYFHLTERRRRRTYKQLEQTNEELELARNELEQSNGKLERTNAAISSYAATALHQAKHLLNQVKDRAQDLANSGDSAERTTHLTAIEVRVDSVKRRLEDSKDKFGYEETVRKKVATHETRGGFDLYDSLVDVVNEDFPASNVKLHPPQWEGSRPTLCATGSGLLDEGGELQDGYFREAMQVIIRNAIDYRRPEESTITLSLEVEQGWAVIRASNDGPTVPDDKVESVFEMGSRYGGAVEDSSPSPAPRDGVDHLGLGLFILSQIVRGCKGSCRLDNRLDRSGVVVTVRLPVTFSPDTVLRQD